MKLSNAPVDKVNSMQGVNEQTNNEWDNNDDEDINAKLKRHVSCM